MAAVEGTMSTCSAPVDIKIKRKAHLLSVVLKKSAQKGPKSRSQCSGREETSRRVSLQEDLKNLHIRHLDIIECSENRSLRILLSSWTVD